MSIFRPLNQPIAMSVFRPVLAGILAGESSDPLFYDPLSGLPTLEGSLAKSDPETVAFTAPTAQAIQTSQIIGVVLPDASEITIPASTAISLDTGSYSPGADYAVHCTSAGSLVASASFTPPSGGVQIGGFHFAPGGNAVAQAGGDTTPAINPYSIWDLRFRPACLDPRGMALIAGRFWMDIYLTGINPHLDGTSKFGATIADGSNRPTIPAAFGGDGSARYSTYDWFAACETLAGYGKSLPTVEDFQLAAYGVTEGSSIGGDPITTQLDAARTSKYGLIQATGNLWSWCRDSNNNADDVTGWGWQGVTGGRGSHYMRGSTFVTRALAGGNWLRHPRFSRRQLGQWR